jgi:hypothetical protein
MVKLPVLEIGSADSLSAHFGQAARAPFRRECNKKRLRQGYKALHTGLNKVEDHLRDFVCSIRRGDVASQNVIVVALNAGDGDDFLIGLAHPGKHGFDVLGIDDLVSW